MDEPPMHFLMMVNKNTTFCEQVGLASQFPSQITCKKCIRKIKKAGYII